MPEMIDEHGRPPALALGANLAGYFDAHVGVGEAVRNVEAALGAAGVSVARLALGHGSAAAEAPHPATIVCANPDGMAGARAELPAAFDGPRVIGLWWWEVMAFPSHWLRAFDGVDEVWVGSRFVADALAAVSPVPVVAMPMPVPAPRPAAVDRAALGLPDGFLFGFAFDYASVVERKNPLGLIEAFSRAFPPDARGTEALVLKTLAGDRHPREHGAVVRAASAHPRIHVVDRDLAHAERDALIGALDCYVSLHRSEGFGLTIAEAMLARTPVIATGYGAPRELLTPFNSLIADHRLVPIGAGHDPYPPEGEWAEPDLDHAAALMRALRDEPEQARRRAERARADVLARHSPQVAGRAIAARLARCLSLPHADGRRVDALDTSAAERRLRGGPAAAPGTGRARGALRDAVLRALRPYSVHQRLVDEELLALVRTLDERVRGLAAGQGTLAAELARLRRSGDGDDGVPPSPGS
jgi:hypothetical protein